MDLIHLQKNENPPSDLQSVTITRESHGVDISEGPIVQHEGGATFYVPYRASEEQFEAVKKKAQEWAVRAGITKIYIQD